MAGVRMRFGEGSNLDIAVGSAVALVLGFEAEEEREEGPSQEPAVLGAKPEVHQGAPRCLGLHELRPLGDAGVPPVARRI